MVLQDRQLDFEDFSSDTEKLSAILKRCELSCQKHKLAYEYYRARKLALLHPSVLACLAIGVLSFLVSTDVVKRHMKVGTVRVLDILTLTVGFLGFFVGTCVLLANQWGHGSREGMHLSAQLELEALGDRVRFWRMDRGVGSGRYGDDHTEDGGGPPRNVGRSDDDERKALGVVNEPESHKVAMVVASGKQLKRMEHEIQEKTVRAKKTENKRSDVSRFSGFNGAYQQINRSCKSKIPNSLNRPFHLFESRLESMSLGHLGIVWDTRMRRNQIMRLAAVEIYNEITGYWLWPFGTPDIDKVIDRSMKRVARLISKTYREPIKVECCGFTIFRCCCRHRHTKAHVLHNIFDGMEARERDVMHSRGVPELRYARGASSFPADEKRGLGYGGGGVGVGGGGGRGGRSYSSRSDMYALEEDAYEADQKLQYMEDVQHVEDENYAVDDTVDDEGPSYQFTAYSEEANSNSKGKFADNEASFYDKSPRGSYKDGISKYNNRGNATDNDASFYDQSRRGSYKDGVSKYTNSRGSYRGITAGQHNSSRSNRSREGLTPGIIATVGGAASADDQSELGWDEASASQYG